ncbi:MAG: hypothetical protein KDB14_31990 [Planctomycetales bacterium]|nr:hypothetical protein [Planctomycetales bacterium]
MMAASELARELRAPAPPAPSWLFRFLPRGRRLGALRAALQLDDSAAAVLQLSKLGDRLSAADPKTRVWRHAALQQLVLRNLDLSRFQEARKRLQLFAREFPDSDYLPALRCQVLERLAETKDEEYLSEAKRFLEDAARLTLPVEQRDAWLEKIVQHGYVQFGASACREFWLAAPDKIKSLRLPAIVLRSLESILGRDTQRSPLDLNPDQLAFCPPLRADLLATQAQDLCRTKRYADVTLAMQRASAAIDLNPKHALALRLLAESRLRLEVARANPRTVNFEGGQLPDSLEAALALHNAVAASDATPRLPDLLQLAATVAAKCDHSDPLCEQLLARALPVSANWRSDELRQTRELAERMVNARSEVEPSRWAARALGVDAVFRMWDGAAGIEHLHRAGCSDRDIEVRIAHLWNGTRQPSQQATFHWVDRLEGVVDTLFQAGPHTALSAARQHANFRILDRQRQSLPEIVQRLLSILSWIYGQSGQSDQPQLPPHDAPAWLHWAAARRVLLDRGEAALPLLNDRLDIPVIAWCVEQWWFQVETDRVVPPQVTKAAQVLDTAIAADSSAALQQWLSAVRDRRRHSSIAPAGFKPITMDEVFQLRGAAADAFFAECAVECAIAQARCLMKQNDHGAAQQLLVETKDRIVRLPMQIAEMWRPAGQFWLAIAHSQDPATDLAVELQRLLGTRFDQAVRKKLALLAMFHGRFVEAESWWQGESSNSGGTVQHAIRLRKSGALSDVADYLNAINDFSELDPLERQLALDLLRQTLNAEAMEDDDLPRCSERSREVERLVQNKLAWCQANFAFEEIHRGDYRDAHERLSNTSVTLEGDQFQRLRDTAAIMLGDVGEGCRYEPLADMEAALDRLAGLDNNRSECADVAASNSDSSHRSSAELAQRLQHIGQDPWCARFPGLIEAAQVVQAALRTFLLGLPTEVEPVSDRSPRWIAYLNARCAAATGSIHVPTAPTVTADQWFASGWAHRQRLDQREELGARSLARSRTAELNALRQANGQSREGEEAWGLGTRWQQVCQADLHLEQAHERLRRDCSGATQPPAEVASAFAAQVSEAPALVQAGWTPIRDYWLAVCLAPKSPEEALNIFRQLGESFLAPQAASRAALLQLAGGDGEQAAATLARVIDESLLRRRVESLVRLGSAPTIDSVEKLLEHYADDSGDYFERQLLGGMLAGPLTADVAWSRSQLIRCEQLCKQVETLLGEFSWTQASIGLKEWLVDRAVEKAAARFVGAAELPQVAMWLAATRMLLGEAAAIDDPQSPLWPLEQAISRLQSNASAGEVNHHLLNQLDAVAEDENCKHLTGIVDVARLVARALRAVWGIHSTHEDGTLTLLAQGSPAWQIWLAARAATLGSRDQVRALFNESQFATPTIFELEGWMALYEGDGQWRPSKQYQTRFEKYCRALQKKHKGKQGKALAWLQLRRQRYRGETSRRSSPGPKLEGRWAGIIQQEAAIELKFSEARMQLSRGDSQPASKHFKELLSHLGDASQLTRARWETAVSYWLGVSQARSGDAAAGSTLERLTDTILADQAQSQLAMLDLQLGDLEAADRRLQGLEPLPAVEYARAVLNSRRKQFDAADRCFQTLGNSNSHHFAAAAHRLAAANKERQGDDAAAAGMHREILKRHPQDSLTAARLVRLAVKRDLARSQQLDVDARLVSLGRRSTPWFQSYAVVIDSLSAIPDDIGGVAEGMASVQSKTLRNALSQWLIRSLCESGRQQDAMKISDCLSASSGEGARTRAIFGIWRAAIELAGMDAPPEAAERRQLDQQLNDLRQILEATESPTAEPTNSDSERDYWLQLARRMERGLAAESAWLVGDEVDHPLAVIADLWHEDPQRRREAGKALLNEVADSDGKASPRTKLLRALASHAVGKRQDYLRLSLSLLEDAAPLPCEKSELWTASAAFQLEDKKWTEVIEAYGRLPSHIAENEGVLSAVLAAHIAAAVDADRRDEPQKALRAVRAARTFLRNRMNRNKS